MNKRYLDRCWSDYTFAKNMKSESALRLRNELVGHYVHLAHITANKMSYYAKFGIETEDLVGEGLRALVKAVEDFLIDRNVKFETYAISCIQNSIIGYSRSQDNISRSERNKIRNWYRYAQAYEGAYNESPTIQECASSLGVSEQQILCLQAAHHNELTVPLDDVADYCHSGDNVFASVYEHDLKQSIDEASRNLPEREAFIIQKHYQEYETCVDIAAMLGISGTRTQQLRHRALRHLKQKLASYI